MDEAKLPPPTPASAATSTSASKGSSGWWTAQASALVGRRSRRAETIVQFRPPKAGTANV